MERALVLPGGGKPPFLRSWFVSEGNAEVACDGGLLIGA